MSGLEITATGLGAAGTLLGGYGEYKSGMDTAAAIDASRPYDLINSANKAQGLRYAADTSLAGAQRQALARAQDKNLLLSKSRAMSAAGTSLSVSAHSGVYSAKCALIWVSNWAKLV